MSKLILDQRTFQTGTLQPKKKRIHIQNEMLYL